MQKQLRLLALCSLALVALPAGADANLQLNLALTGTPERLGTLIATTSVSNHSTATPFNNTGAGLRGKLVLIQCDAAANIAFCTTNSCTASAAATGNGFHIAQYQSVTVWFDTALDYGWIAAVSDSGTANCKVWDLHLR